MSNNTQLPVEVVDDIKEKAELSTDFLSNNEAHSRVYLKGYKQGWVDGATEYATKLHESHKEVNRLTNWKQEAKDILNPIWNYAEQHINVPLGKSKTEAVIKHVIEAKDLLTEVFQKHESGLLPDRFVYDKIKKYLHGE